MNIMVMDSDFKSVTILDSFESIVWADRYRACGDFELYTAVNTDILSKIRKNYYVTNGNSEHVMIIEQLLITSDVEEGNKIAITGRSLESILDRRIVWGLKNLNGNLQEAIKTLLNECIINPTDVNRKIDNFIFEYSDDSYIKDLTIEAQYTGDDLYDIIVAICEERDIGFKITLNQDNQFVFKLYRGVDRSYNQSQNSYVVFAPEFENIINSSYLTANQELKNVTLIGGEGEGTERKYTYVGDAKGLDRRELFTDARDISSNIGDVSLSTDEYIALLQQRGNEKLAEKVDKVAFEGEVETTLMFKYGIDYFLGDTVTIRNEYRIEAAPQIIEIVESLDESGYSIIPTFKYTNVVPYILAEDFRIIKTEDGDGLILENGLVL